MKRPVSAPLDPWDSCRQQFKISKIQSSGTNDEDSDADFDESSTSQLPQFETDTASTFDNSREITTTETIDKAAVLLDVIQFELSNNSGNENTVTISERDVDENVNVQLDDGPPSPQTETPRGVLAHLVDEEEVGDYYECPCSSQDLPDELHEAIGEKLTCQPEYHTANTKFQLNIEKLSEEIFERFSAKFQDSSIAKDIAKEVVKLLDTSNEQETEKSQCNKETFWHDGGNDEIICIISG